MKQAKKYLCISQLKMSSAANFPLNHLSVVDDYKLNCLNQINLLLMVGCPSNNYLNAIKDLSFQKLKRNKIRHEYVII